MTRRLILPLVLVAAACGDDGGTTPPMPDAAPDGTIAPMCHPTVGEISSYPGTYMGTNAGGGADLNVPEGTCATENANPYWAPVGDDVVIKLTNLVPGQAYVVQLTTMTDLSFYVTTACPPATGTPTGCLVFSDLSFEDEEGLFTASATEHWLVVDAPADESMDPPGPPATGTFTVTVTAAECTVDTELEDCGTPTPATPFCVDFKCVECSQPLHCTTAATPVCNAMNDCVAGPNTCTGDDTRDTTAPGDDGPAAATMLAAPTAGVPTTVMGGICNSGGEQDWYKVTLAADGDLGIEVTFTGATNDIDVYLLDAGGDILQRGEADAGINEAIRGDDLLAGTYYILVNQFLPMNNGTAVSYTLRVAVPECDDAFDCTIAAAPTCNPAGRCAVGPATCMGDDAGDAATGDDGPAAARTLVTGVASTGSICPVRGEEDWYKIIVTNGQGIDLSVAWTGAADLDPAILNASNEILGFSFYLNPENVKVTYLPAGTYYVRLVQFANMASTTSTMYTITATATAAQTCASSADCAAEHKTQVYRGNCSGGSCQFIAAGMRAEGMACDTNNDCTNGRCSYLPFEADAQDSVCTRTCMTGADCAAVAGTTCTMGLQTNICVPACANNLECGANPGSSTLDMNQPWNFLTCSTPGATGTCAP